MKLSPIYYNLHALFNQMAIYIGVSVDNHNIQLHLFILFLLVYTRKVSTYKWQEPIRALHTNKRNKQKRKNLTHYIIVHS